MLFTPEYQEQQRQMHKNLPEYGTTGEQYGPMVAQVIDAMGVETVLDYGAGHNLSLLRTLKPQRKFKYSPYDPGVDEYSDRPEPADLVCCIDVLEHIEPECVEDVMDDLESLCRVALFATVHTGPAGKTLPDGRNAHLIQREVDFWLPLFWDRFDIVSLSRRSMAGFEVLAHARTYD